MRIPLLALSDTHLGEDTSLLHFEAGRERLAEAITNVFGEGATLDELVLIGDIPDRTLSSTAQIQEDTRAFMCTLERALKLHKVVYVPGNHDHSLWSAYVRGACPDGLHESDITDADGVQFLAAGDRPDEAGPGMEGLLKVFFAPDRAVPYEFVVANPLYARRFDGRQPTYVFTHGTHFRGDVSASPGVLNALIRTGIGHWLAGLHLRTDGKLSDQRTMRELEAAVTPLVDSLWPSAGESAITEADKLWFLLCTLSGKFCKSRVILEGEDDELVCRMSAPDQARGRIEDLTPKHRACHGSLRRFRENFYRVLPRFLAESGLPDRPLTLIYGDTHAGGWGHLPDEDIRVYNTGAWVVTGWRHHPPCHLFCIPEVGEEFLLDVSFQYVRQDSDSLLWLAARDVENRKSRVAAEAPTAALAELISQLG